MVDVKSEPAPAKGAAAPAPAAAAGKAAAPAVKYNDPPQLPAIKIPHCSFDTDKTPLFRLSQPNPRKMYTKVNVRLYNEPNAPGVGGASKASSSIKVEQSNAKEAPKTAAAGANPDNKPSKPSTSDTVVANSSTSATTTSTTSDNKNSAATAASGADAKSQEQTADKGALAVATDFSAASNPVAPSATSPSTSGASSSVVTKPAKPGESATQASSASKSTTEAAKASVESTSTSSLKVTTGADKSTNGATKSKSGSSSVSQDTPRCFLQELIGFMPASGHSSSSGAQAQAQSQSEIGFQGCRERLMSFLSGFDVLWMIRGGIRLPFVPLPLHFSLDGNHSLGPKRISLFHDIEYQRGKKAFYVAQVHLHLPLSRTFLPWLKRCHTLAISGASTIFGPADAAKPIPGRINSALMTQVAKVAPSLKRLVLHSANDSTVSKALACLKNLEGLKLRGCGPAVQAPEFNSKSLMHLDVSRCRNLVDRAIKQACTGLKNLRSINASYCDRLQRPEFSGANLQSIKLVGCIGVTKITIDQCPVLEVVDLRGCRRLEASEVIYTSEKSRVKESEETKDVAPLQLHAPDANWLPGVGMGIPVRSPSTSARSPSPFSLGTLSLISPRGENAAGSMAKALGGTAPSSAVSPNATSSLFAAHAQRKRKIGETAGGTSADGEETAAKKSAPEPEATNVAPPTDNSSAKARKRKLDEDSSSSNAAASASAPTTSAGGDAAPPAKKLSKEDQSGSVASVADPSVGGTADTSAGSATTQTSADPAQPSVATESASTAALADSGTATENSSSAGGAVASGSSTDKPTNITTSDASSDKAMSKPVETGNEVSAAAGGDSAVTNTAEASGTEKQESEQTTDGKQLAEETKNDPQSDDQKAGATTDTAAAVDSASDSVAAVEAGEGENQTDKTPSTEVTAGSGEASTSAEVPDKAASKDDPVTAAKGEGKTDATKQETEEKKDPPSGDKVDATEGAEKDAKGSEEKK